MGFLIDKLAEKYPYIRERKWWVLFILDVAFFVVAIAIFYKATPAMCPPCPQCFLEAPPQSWHVDI